MTRQEMVDEAVRRAIPDARAGLLRLVTKRMFLRGIIELPYGPWANTLLRQTGRHFRIIEQEQAK